MAQKLSIYAIITAIDNATAPVRKLAANLKSSFATIGKGVGKAVSSLADFATAATKWAAVGAVALAGAVGALGLSWLDAAGELDDFSRQVGVGVEALQELRYAAKLSGVESEVLGGALAALNKGMGQAKAGTGKLAGFLGKVSPALLAQVKAAKTTDEAFTTIVQAMQQLPDPARRAALAAAAFGGSGAEIARMADDGAEGLAKLREEFRKAGGGMSAEQVAAAAELGDSIDRLKLSLSGVATTLLSRLVPIVGPLVDKLRDWITANRDLIGQKFDEAIRWVGDAIDRIDWPKTIEAVKEFGRAIGKAWEFIGGLKGAAGLYAGLMATKLIPAIQAVIPIVGALINVFRVLFATMMANPILAVVALLAGAIALVIANWSDFEEFGAELWRTLKQLWADGTGALSAFWSELSRTALQVWADFKSSIGEVWDSVVGVFEAAWQKIAAIVDRVTGAVDTVLGGVRKASDFVGLTTPAAAAPAGTGAGLAGLLGPAMMLPTAANLAAATAPGAAQVSGSIAVRFDNPPPGMRLSEASSSSPGLAISASTGRRTMSAGVPL